jgi:hypothetical protein
MTRREWRIALIVSLLSLAVIAAPEQLSRLLSVPVSAGQEQYALTTPIVPTGPATTTYTVRRIVLAWDEQLIQITLRDNNNDQITHVYQGSAATALMVALNKANLTIKSLQRRVIEQLVADGKLPAGSVTGSPQ